jgi:hypothetical protein
MELVPPGPTHCTELTIQHLAFAELITLAAANAPNWMLFGWALIYVLLKQ